MTTSLHSISGLHVGIDASNIRQGGGLTHLSQLLEAADPAVSGASCVSVWATKATLGSLPDRPWLRKCNPSWTESFLPIRIVGQQFLIPRYLKNDACDVLFTPGATLMVRSSVPTVSMSQNMLPFEPREAKRFGALSGMRLKLFLLRYAQSSSFRHANGTIFLTDYAERAVIRALGNIAGLTTQIPHGIEPRFIQEQSPPKELASYSFKNPLTLLYVSILMPYKHQVEVALAVKQLREEDLPIQIIFVGESWGKYGQDFRSLLDKLDPDAEFLIWRGGEPFSALHNTYRNADIFVFASSCENLPNIMIEAMASGLPIASSSSGPMPEVLKDAGVYFDSEQPSSIADALRKLITNPKLRSDLGRSAAIAAANYSWERCAHDTFEFIAKVARQ